MKLVGLMQLALLVPGGYKAMKADWQFFSSKRNEPSQLGITYFFPHLLPSAASVWCFTTRCRNKTQCCNMDQGGMGPCLACTDLTEKITPNQIRLDLCSQILLTVSLTSAATPSLPVLAGPSSSSPIHSSLCPQGCWRLTAHPAPLPPAGCVQGRGQLPRAGFEHSLCRTAHRLQAVSTQVPSSAGGKISQLHSCLPQNPCCVC